MSPALEVFAWAGGLVAVLTLLGAAARLIVLLGRVVQLVPVVDQIMRTQAEHGRQIRKLRRRVRRNANPTPGRTLEPCPHVSHRSR
jgi:hypothetical protein